MINNAIYILLVLLALGEIALIVCFVNLMGKVRDAASANRYFSAIEKLLEVHRKQIEDLKKSYDRLYKTSELTNEQYKIMSDSYKIMVHQLKTISDQHSKILESWKNVEDRYSDCFEQYKHTHECLKKCMDLMTPIATEIPESIEELGMKLNDVQEIVSRIDDNTTPNSVMVNYTKWNPDDMTATDQWWKETEESETDDDYFNATEGETPPDPDAMKEFYETNGFEEIRKKALTEDS